MTVTSNMQMLKASSYTQLDRSLGDGALRKELERVISAQPTQLHPDERESYIKALLDDLEARPGAPWRHWSDDIYHLAMTALKSLSRNPMGTTSLYDPHYMSILISHSCLAASKLSSSGPVSSSSMSTTTTQVSNSGNTMPVTFFSPPDPAALEATRVLANTLVLHPQARDVFSELSGGALVARGLKDVAGAGEEVDIDRLFLFGRVGFLVTVNQPVVVRESVHDEGLVHSLAEILTKISIVPSNYLALSETLKLANNIVRYYPSQKEWDDKLDPLLLPILTVFHQIPFDDIAPPLNHAIHVLLSIPFSADLLETWYTSPPHANASTSSPAGNSRSTMDKISSLLASARTSLDHRDRSTAPSRSSSSVPVHDSGFRRGSSAQASSTSRSSSPSQSSHAVDSTALPSRLLKILVRFFDSHLPFPKNAEEDLPDGLAIEEVLPPVILLLARVAEGSEPIRSYLKLQLFPPDLDRSVSAGPLESRSGMLGSLLRLLNGSSHTQCRDTVGELLWAICDANEIGYGNAAGLLFRKGLSGPPEARIEEIHPVTPFHSQRNEHGSPTPSSPTTSSDQPHKSSTKHSQIDRHPITGLRGSPSGKNEHLDEMTQEEKEREAEKLFVLFDRIEKNPVLSMRQDDDSKGKIKSGGKGEGALGGATDADGTEVRAGEGKEVRGIKDLMRERLESGEMDNWERNDEEMEKRRLEEEERKEEEEVGREMRAYKSRMGKK